MTELPYVTELPCVTCRSPVYATFTEALDGAASIRAYNAQHRFCQLNEQQVALSQQAAFAGKPAITIWLLIRVQMKRTNSLEGVWRDWNELWSCQPNCLPFQATSFMSVAGIDSLSTVISKDLVIMHALIPWVVQWLKTSAFVLRHR